MLEKVRNNVKSFGVQLVIIVVVASFIGTIFLVWGHGGKSERQGTLLAKIYDHDITYPEYQQEYLQLIQNYRHLYRDKWSDAMVEQLNIKKIAMDNIINQYVVFHTASEWGIKVSNQEVMDYIRDLPAFQMNGAFSPDLYRQRLDMARISPEAFEQDILKNLLFMRVQERVAGGFKISDDVVKERFAREHEKIKADYLLVLPERFSPQIQTGLQELRDYFERHKEQYRHQERRTVEYLFLQPKDFEKDVEIRDEEIQNYYTLHESSFMMPKQIRASHILAAVKPDASAGDDAKQNEKALDLLKKIQAGEDFHELAKQYSDCPSGQRGGDLGYFGKGKMDPEFEKAAFALNMGEVSQVIKSSFGYHIIKLEDIKSEHVRPVEEVKEQIIRELKREKAKALALTKTEDLVKEIYRGKAPREFAFDTGVTYSQVGPFFKGENIPVIGRSKEVTDTVFETGIDQISKIIETPKGYFVIKVLAIEPPRDMTYEEAEARVAQDIKLELASKTSLKEAEKMRHRIQNGEDLNKVALEYNLEVFDAGEFGMGGYVSGLGMLKEQETQTLFSLKPGDVSPVMDFSPKGFVLFRIKGKTRMNEEEFARKKEFLRAQLLQTKQQELFNAWVERARKDSGLEIFNKDFAV